jgi:hypothetical protein
MRTTIKDLEDVDTWLACMLLKKYEPIETQTNEHGQIQDQTNEHESSESQTNEHESSEP